MKSIPCNHTNPSKQIYHPRACHDLGVSGLSSISSFDEIAGSSLFVDPFYIENVGRLIPWNVLYLLLYDMLYNNWWTCYSLWASEKVLLIGWIWIGYKKVSQPYFLYEFPYSMTVKKSLIKLFLGSIPKN